MKQKNNLFLSLFEFLSPQKRQTQTTTKTHTNNNKQRILIITQKVLVVVMTTTTALQHHTAAVVMTTTTQLLVNSSPQLWLLSPKLRPINHLKIFAQNLGCAKCCKLSLLLPCPYFHSV
eukprot:GHVS01068040.1.p3 GENE.GHVS01068040.1~~GHVS01068040.1.p3  ORF type:complete len:119 (+),score=23.94 GHVS01068040.1:811-1167(+)